MKTVTFLTLKGGVGKTSTTFHLSGTLARAGHRVLLVDNDPQASLTQGFWGPSGLAGLDPAVTVAAIYPPDASPEPDGLIAPTGITGIWLIPGSPDAAAWNLPPGTDWSASQWALHMLLEGLGDRFDLCLIDCAPNLHLLGWAALLAADALVVPLQPEDFGSQGLSPVTASFAAATRFNADLTMAGYLLTMTDKRLGVHATYEAMLREQYGPRVFTHTVPRAKDFIEAVGSRQPVSHYKPKSAATRAIQAIADELLVRIHVVPAGQGVAA